jgi:glycosyltransferase involved in cell wall biosynthesis
MEHVTDPVIAGKVEAGATPVMASWLAIFRGLCRLPPLAAVPAVGAKPVVTIVADGGWGPWLGRDILTKGMGGSETWVVEMARWIQAAGRFDCVVFCNTPGGCGDVFEGVVYRPLSDFYVYAATVAIHTCIVSRYSEYVPVAVAGTPRQVILVLHDLGPTGIVVPMDPKLKRVLCLTDWHVGYFTGNFPQLADRTESFYYGIDQERFLVGDDDGLGQSKRPHSFIYSSFPNRGLLQLLRMWPAILRMWPDATLDIYSDIEGKWVNEVDPAEMEAIKILLNRGLPGVTVHGWVSKGELAAAWRRADIWLYPATFQETFCLTALEAAAAGCLTVAPPLAALRETAAHGILVAGDAREPSWHQSALAALAACDSNSAARAKMIAAGKAWAAASSWKSRAATFIEKYLVG